MIRRALNSVRCQLWVYRYLCVYINQAGPENFNGETENYACCPRAMLSAARPTVRHGMNVRHAGTARLYKRILGTYVNGYTAVMRIRYVYARQTLGTEIRLHRLAPVIADIIACGSRGENRRVELGREIALPDKGLCFMPLHAVRCLSGGLNFTFIVFSRV